MSHSDLIDRNSKMPLYFQLYEILRSNIRNGIWIPGNMIPPESELVARYKISRTTIRQVLDMLVSEGLIYRERGRGSFVAEPALEEALVRIISFTDDMRQRGRKPSTEILTSELIPAPQDIAERLKIEAGEELAHLIRLRLADDEPMSIEDSYLIHRHCPGILNGDYGSNSLREAIQRRYGILWSHAKQVIRAILATGNLAKSLSIRPGDALLYIERVSFSQQHRIPVEFLRIYYRGDRYSLYNELQP
ncbi:GntR family transcriptional regulator [Candidatus Poribacteria bacterium]